jgi:hypothetical protein
MDELWCFDALVMLCLWYYIDLEQLDRFGEDLVRVWGKGTLDFLVCQNRSTGWFWCTRTGRPVASRGNFWVFSFRIWFWLGVVSSIYCRLIMFSMTCYGVLEIRCCRDLRIWIFLEIFIKIFIESCYRDIGPGIAKLWFLLEGMHTKLLDWGKKSIKYCIRLMLWLLQFRLRSKSCYMLLWRNPNRG